MAPLKLCFWTRQANHYQRSFVRALGAQCDLETIYFERMPADRLALGWNESPDLDACEHLCESLNSALQVVSDWRERIHLVPNYGGPFQRQLAKHLVANKAKWIDWSESSSPGLRWWLRAPVKAWWTYLVNHHALGSLAIGLRAEHDFARRHIPRSRTAYLPYCSASEWREDPDEATANFNAGRKAFVFLGSLSKRKGTDLLLQAAAKVLKPACDWTLVLVGNDAPGERFKQVAARLGIADKVMFRGPVSPDRLPGILAACSVLVMPSRYDGWGVAMNEALLSGRAIITSHMCGAGDHLVISGRNGFRIEAGSVSQLADAMNMYIQKPCLAAHHGAQSKGLVHLIDPHTNAAAMLRTIGAWLAAPRMVMQ